jgi:hypothetical protein
MPVHAYVVGSPVQVPNNEAQCQVAGIRDHSAKSAEPVGTTETASAEVAALVDGEAEAAGTTSIRGICCIDIARDTAGVPVAAAALSKLGR